VTYSGIFHGMTPWNRAYLQNGMACMNKLVVPPKLAGKQPAGKDWFPVSAI